MPPPDLTADGRGGSSSGAPSATSTPPPERSASRAPLPSSSHPLALACACLNVTVDTRVSDSVDADKLKASSKTEQVWLASDAEQVLHRDMATFERVDTDQSWRKCWICGVRVYRAERRQASDTAPVDAWVDVDFANGVLFGSALEKAEKKPALPFSGLRLDLPSSSSFGRPPKDTGPVPYPAVAATTLKTLLPPVPDPFFLPPPFIPNHAVLRDICKSAVESLHERHDEIEREIKEYIAKRTGDMHRLEDQVRAEVELLWTRYSEGPGAGDDATRRRSSIALSGDRDRSRSPAVARQSFDAPRDAPRMRELSKSRSRSKETRRREPKQIPTTDIDTPSGVTHSPPKISGQFNNHTAVAAASLLSASLSANAFHAPQRRQATDEEQIESIAKATQEAGVSREVAMSYAFSALDEFAATGKRFQKHETKVAEEIEEQAEDTEKGIDSWINIERAVATKKGARDERVLEREAREKIREMKKEEKKEERKDKKTEVNGADGVDGHAERKGRVKFSEPQKGDEHEHEDGEVDGEGEDDDGVFEFDSDVPRMSPPSQADRQRTLVEDNLSRAFAAEAPSHRAAWRRWEARESIANVLHHQPVEDEDEDSSPLDASLLARSMPVKIVKPASRGLPTQIKTSLTDRGGVVVPALFAAMRERGLKPSSEGDGEDGSPSPDKVGFRPRGSIAIAGRRGSRSGDREREQVMSYRQDPGAVFEALAEGAIADEDDEETPREGTFIPPHIVAARRESTKPPEPGWRSLARD